MFYQQSCGVPVVLFNKYLPKHRVVSWMNTVQVIKLHNFNMYTKLYVNIEPKQSKLQKLFKTLLIGYHANQLFASVDCHNRVESIKS